MAVRSKTGLAHFNIAQGKPKKTTQGNSKNTKLRKNTKMYRGQGKR